MRAKKGNSLFETKRQNRILIKNMIFRMRHATRNRIADHLELTLPTITTSVNEMIAENIIREVEIDQSHLGKSVGRRPNAIEFCSDAAYAIGVDLGPYRTDIVLMNLGGEVLHHIKLPKAAESYDDMVEKLAKEICEISRLAAGKNLLGVGIALPGFIDTENGIIRSNMRKQWVGHHLAKDMEDRVQMPVIINNNVRTRAIGYEMNQKDMEKADTFAYFYVSKGVACPLMVSDDVVNGYTAGAGELGHTVLFVQTEQGIREQILDDLASERAVFEKCQHAMLTGRLPELKETMQKEGLLTMKQILALQAAGNEEIAGIINDVIYYMGAAMANIVNLVNPAFVVVDAYMMKNECNRRLLEKTAKQRFFGLNEEEVAIRFLPFDSEYGAKTAAFYVIRQMFLNI